MRPTRARPASGRLNGDLAEIEWAARWKPLPKVAFSTTLSAVEGNARLASGGIAEEIERLRAEPGDGEIAIGGATLAAEAAALDLIDEYRAVVYPVLVGGGNPYVPQHERRGDLELAETRTFSSSIVYLRYPVARYPTAMSHSEPRKTTEATTGEAARKLALHDPIVVSSAAWPTAMSSETATTRIRSV